MAHDPDLTAADLIIPMPASSATGTAGRDHVAQLIDSAMQQAEADYPFRLDPPVIVKSRPTGQMAATRGMGERAAPAGMS